MGSWCFKVQTFLFNQEAAIMSSESFSPLLDRRVFLKRLGIVSMGYLTVERLLRDPYAFALPARAAERGPIRITGTVQSKGTGIAGVAVSDGLRVVTTNGEGAFTLVSSGTMPFVFVSIPSGYMIPTHPAGTARFFKPIPHEGDSMQEQWDLDRLPDSDNDHGFLLLADPQTLDTDDMDRFHKETVPDIRSVVKEMSLQSVFAVGCGDIMFDKLDLFPGYEAAVKQMGIPAFQVLGNHDVESLAQTDEAAATTFMRYFGPTYYSFNRGEVHYVVLDDVFWHGYGYLGYLEQGQLDWLKADLALVEKGRTVVIFTHIPSYNEQHVRLGQKSPSKSTTIVNREALNRLLEPYKAHIIVGHMHESEHLIDHGSRIHVCGAVCGAWWTGDICDDGTPNGYPVYEVHGSDLRWRYKSTGKPFDHQIRIYPRGSDPKRPDEVITNVWDATSEWKIDWYEGGERRGAMTPGRGLDPLSVKLHSGPELPSKHTWVDPIPTDHLFFARTSPDAKEIIVEATDAWGRVYREKMKS
jgi:hypothetical protein